MVAARGRFLENGYYRRMSEAIATAARDVDGVVVDLADGTGHHLAAVLDARPRRSGCVSICPRRRSAAPREPIRGRRRLARTHGVHCRGLKSLTGTPLS